METSVHAENAASDESRQRQEAEKADYLLLSKKEFLSERRRDSLKEVSESLTDLLLDVIFSLDSTLDFRHEAILLQE